MVREVREHKPDLLTLDLTMPGGSSLGALPSCFIAHPTLAVAILTMREDPEYARQALRAGARSYVLKEAEPAELLQAFRLAVAGGNYLHPRLGALMATGEDGVGDGVVLSEREREVVQADRQRLHQPRDRRAAERRRAHRQDLPRPRHREARLLLARGDHRLRAQRTGWPTERDGGVHPPVARRGPPRKTVRAILRAGVGSTMASTIERPGRGPPADGHLAARLPAPGRPRRHGRARLDSLPGHGRAQADRARLRARAAPELPRLLRAALRRAARRMSGASTRSPTRRSTWRRCPTST